MPRPPSPREADQQEHDEHDGADAGLHELLGDDRVADVAQAHERALQLPGRHRARDEQRGDLDQGRRGARRA